MSRSRTATVLIWVFGAVAAVVVLVLCLGRLRSHRRVVVVDAVRGFEPPHGGAQVKCRLFDGPMP